MLLKVSCCQIPRGFWIRSNLTVFNPKTSEESGSSLLSVTLDFEKFKEMILSGRTSDKLQNRFPAWIGVRSEEIEESKLQTSNLLVCILAIKSSILTGFFKITR